MSKRLSLIAVACTLFIAQASIVQQAGGQNPGAQARGGRAVTTPPPIAEITAKLAAVDARLSRIRGHESLKATVRYPFDLARVVNAGKRPSITFDYESEIQHSLSLLAELEAGHDLLERAKGDNRRAYWFAEVGEIMPYRVYVPSSWKQGRRLPLVLALHGANLDENDMLTRGDAVMRKMAEQHGYVVVSPFGYRTSAGWGNTMGIVPAARPADGQAARGRGARGAGRGDVAPTPASDVSREQATAWSEKDALNVLAIVEKEYGTDPTRVYVTGNSLGGAGTWYLGQKYPERFVAIAPSAGAIPEAVYPYERLKGIAVFAVHGDADTVTSAPATGAMVNHLKALGFPATFREVKGATHTTAIQEVMPEIFAFFDAHPRKSK
jgi:poly(3-hydroxybutyrate) depolymerase